jgi:preprotein translocase subunit SecD
MRYSLILKLLIPGIFLGFASCSDKVYSSKEFKDQIIADGIYLIHRTGNKTSKILPLSEDERMITFNKEFIEKTDQDVKYLVINTKEFTPLKLKEKPETEDQEDQRKKLLLSLTDDAKETLKQFTTRHLNRLTTIVVGGQALTMHKIRVVIDSGKLQVTRCTDNACELLYFELQDNVVRKK